MSPHPVKVKAVTDMPLPKMKRELQSFLHIVNYLGKFSPMTAEVLEPLRRLTPVNAAWMWKILYQEINERVKSLVKEDTCMKYHNFRKPLYLETNALGVGLGATLLQAKDDLSCRYDRSSTMQCSIPFPLPARAYLVLSSGTAIYGDKHMVSCIG